MTSSTLAERIVEAWEDVPDWANEDTAKVAIEIMWEEAAKKADEHAKFFRTGEFAIGGCLESAIAAEIIADALRAMKGKTK